MKKTKVLAVTVCVVAVVNVASADLVRGINIDFVTIGNPGNPADTQVMTPDGSSGYGSVRNNYRIGKYEITNAQWNTFVSAAGAPTGNPSDAYDQSAYYTGAQQPINVVSWYEALQFCKGGYPLKASCLVETPICCGSSQQSVCMARAVS